MDVSLSTAQSAGSSAATAAVTGHGGPFSPEEKEFLTALNEDLERFNSFFIDKEEEAVIKLQDIADQLNQRDASQEDLSRIKARLVDFHGM